MKKLLILLTIIAIPLILFGLIAIIRSAPARCDLDKALYVDKEKDVNICVSIVQTEEDRAKGLSGAESISENEGMLFVYDDNVRVGYWMKDMLFPLDIIFLAEDGSVVDIKNDLQPCEKEANCPVYTPEKAFMYTIEVNGGFADENDINVDDIVRGL